MSRDKVLLNGFLVDREIPTEGRLKAYIPLDAVRGDVERWADELNRLLLQIDEEYRGEESKVKRKRVDIGFVRDVDGRRFKAASFHPYPSTLVNRLKELRRKTYDLLNECCTVLWEEQAGRYKSKGYFVPAPLAPDLMGKIGELNRRLSEVKRQLAEFEESELFSLVENYVRRTASIEGVARRAEIPDIRVSLIPVSFDREFFTKYLREEEAKLARRFEEQESELERLRAEGLKRLGEELEAERARMLESMRKDLVGRFNDILGAAAHLARELMEGRKTRLKKPARDLEKLVRLARGVGVEFEEAPLKSAVEIFNSKTREDLARAVKQFAESVGVQPSGNPAEDLKMASKIIAGEPAILLPL